MARAGSPRLPAGAEHGWLTGLKARMAFILGVVLVPALLYSFWLAVDAYEERRQQQAAAVASMLRVIANYETEFIDKTRALLLRLAAEPAVRRAEQPACTERLRQARDAAPDYLNFVVLDATGTGVCGSSPELLTSLGQREHFRQLQAGAGFAVSKILPRLAGKGETIVAAVPLREPGTGRFAGALAVGIDLRGFQRAIDSIELAPRGVAYLADGRGRPLIAPAAEVAAVDPLDAEAFEELAAYPTGGIRAQGADGVPRDYFMAEVAGDDVLAVVGLPAPPRFSWLQRELVIGIFAPTLMLALAVVTIWIASDYLVNRHVRALAVTARAYSRGELDLRPDLGAAPDELKEFARTFARMADRIQRREDELRASLRQKEALLREVHHRVKNNLQIVTSLLNLRAQRLRSPAARDAVRQAQMRIAALALVHRSLYENDDVQELELQDLLGELCGMIEEVSAADQGTVQLSVAVDPTRVPVDQAIPLALVVTEAVSNAFKHAFPPKRDGQIEVRLVNRGQHALLVVADDGVGLAGGEEGASGVGVTLMRMLAKQLGGSLTVVEAGGTRLELDFPLPAQEPPPAPAGEPAARTAALA
jgi:two-component sensor histidine kinase